MRNMLFLLSFFMLFKFIAKIKTKRTCYDVDSIEEEINQFKSFASEDFLKITMLLGTTMLSFIYICYYIFSLIYVNNIYFTIISILMIIIDILETIVFINILERIPKKIFAYKKYLDIMQRVYVLFVFYALFKLG